MLQFFLQKIIPQKLLVNGGYPPPLLSMVKDILHFTIVGGVKYCNLTIFGKPILVNN